MNWRDFIHGTILVLFVWIIVPILCIWCNGILRLPVIDVQILKIIGAVLFILGFSVVLYFTWIHVRTGRATPLPVEPPKEFIATGFYRYSRNPMYIAILTTFFGSFLFLGHVLLLAYILVAMPVLHLFILYKEEPELRRVFGKPYIDYTKKVPRWI